MRSALNFSLLTLLLALSSSRALGNAEANLCVLNFLGEGNPVSNAVTTTFKNYTKSKLVRNAIPMDLVRCIEEGYSEVLLVAHAFGLTDETLPQAQKVKLGYFLQREITVHNSQRLVYEQKIFLDRVFQLAEKAVHLPIKLRMMFCAPNDVLKEYPSLQSLVRNRQVEFDLAPTSPFLSLFHEIPVTSFDVSWLSKSIDCFSLSEWRTESNPRCKKDWWSGCDRKTAHVCRPLAN